MDKNTLVGALVPSTNTLPVKYAHHMPSEPSVRPYNDIKQKKSAYKRPSFFVGAAGRTRTDTGVSPLDFESSASASFTTAANIKFYLQKARIFGKIIRYNNFSGNSIAFYLKIIAQFFL